MTKLTTARSIAMGSPALVKSLGRMRDWNDASWIAWDHDLASLPDAKDLDAFVEQRKVADNKPPTIRRDGDALIVDFGKSDYFGTPPATLDLVITQPSAANVRGWRVQVPFAANSAAP